MGRTPSYKGHTLIPFFDGNHWGVTVQFSDWQPPVRTNTYFWLSEAFSAARQIVDRYSAHKIGNFYLH